MTVRVKRETFVAVVEAAIGADKYTNLAPIAKRMGVSTAACSHILSIAQANGLVHAQVGADKRWKKYKGTQLFEQLKENMQVLGGLEVVVDRMMSR